MTMSAEEVAQLAGIVITLASVVVAIGVLWRYFIRPLWRMWRRSRARLKAVLELVDRELTHNGGSSLKDAVSRIDRTVTRLSGDLEVMRKKETDTAAAVEVLAQFMDRVIDRKQEEHNQLWTAIRDRPNNP